MAQRSSYQQQLLAVQNAARVLKNQVLLDAAYTLTEIWRLEQALQNEQDPEKVQEILERLFVRS